MNEKKITRQMNKILMEKRCDKCETKLKDLFYSYTYGFLCFDCLTEKVGER
jgi:hypothetical protein